jgi:uncharacterized protein (TIGR00369 family)
VQLTLADARGVLTAQPFSVLVGAQLTAFEPGRAVLEVEVRDELRQQFGLVHGGVIGYLVDNVITFAAGTVLGPRVLTAGYSLELVAAATGVRVIAESTVVQASSRRAVCRAEVYSVARDGARTLCAIGQGTISTVHDSRTAGSSS